MCQHKIYILNDIRTTNCFHYLNCGRLSQAALNIFKQQRMLCLRFLSPFFQRQQHLVCHFPYSFKMIFVSFPFLLDACFIIIKWEKIQRHKHTEWHGARRASHSIHTTAQCFEKVPTKIKENTTKWFYSVQQWHSQQCYSFWTIRTIRDKVFFNDYCSCIRRAHAVLNVCMNECCVRHIYLSITCKM